MEKKITMVNKRSRGPLFETTKEQELGKGLG